MNSDDSRVYYLAVYVEDSFVGYVCNESMEYLQCTASYYDPDDIYSVKMFSGKYDAECYWTYILDLCDPRFMYSRLNQCIGPMVISSIKITDRKLFSTLLRAEPVLQMDMLQTKPTPVKFRDMFR